MSPFPHYLFNNALPFAPSKEGNWQTAQEIYPTPPNPPFISFTDLEWILREIDLEGLLWIWGISGSGCWCDTWFMWGWEWAGESWSSSFNCYISPLLLLFRNRWDTLAAVTSTKRLNLSRRNFGGKRTMLILDTYKWYQSSCGDWKGRA